MGRTGDCLVQRPGGDGGLHTSEPTCVIPGFLANATHKIIRIANLDNPN